jgi:hypothetical protein
MHYVRKISSITTETKLFLSSYLIIIIALVFLRGEALYDRLSQPEEPSKKEVVKRISPPPSAKLRYASIVGGGASRVESSNTWNCSAGSCTGGDGVSYSCGLVKCGTDVSRCGCTCLEVGGTPYPKGFCGKNSPYLDKQSDPNTYREWRFDPFG